MASRLLLQVFLITLPFMAYGIYRLVLKDAAIEGRKAWPIRMLFGIGIGLATAAWIILLLIAERSPEMCRTAATLDPRTGEIVPGELYECELETEERYPDAP